MAAADFLQDLERQVAAGVPEPPAQRRRNDGAGSSNEAFCNDAFLKDLLRFTLCKAQDTQQLMNASSLAFLIQAEELKRAVKESLDAYKNKQSHQHNGDLEGAIAKAREERRPLEPHPWGHKKVFTMVILLKTMKQAANAWTDVHQKSRDYLMNLPAEQIDRELSVCQSKFQKPMENRVWKFEILPSSHSSVQSRYTDRIFFFDQCPLHRYSLRSVSRTPN